MVRTDHYSDYEGMGEYTFVQEYNIYPSGKYWVDCSWSRGDGNDETLYFTRPDQWEFSFFGEPDHPVYQQDGPLGTYVYSTDWSTHTAVITICEESNP